MSELPSPLQPPGNMSIYIAEINVGINPEHNIAIYYDISQQLSPLRNYSKSQLLLIWFVPI